MAKGIWGGVGAGILASVVGLGAVSLMAPPPGDRSAVDPAKAIAPVPEASDFGKGPSDPAISAPMTEQIPAADGPALATAPQLEARPALGTDPATRPTASNAPDAIEAPNAAAAALTTPLQGETPIPVPPPGEAQAPGLGRPVSEGIVADPEDAPQVADLDAGPTGTMPETLPAETAPETAPTEPEKATPDAQPSTDSAANPAEKTTDEAEAEKTATEKPEVIIIDAPSTPAGQPAGFAATAPVGFKNAGNVTTNRLPSIGKAPEPEATTSDPTNRPINAFALPFAAEETAPLYSIILVDPGTKAGALDAATLKTIGFPITIAIDPTRADATADADAYRAAGFEVAILASALPQGATAQDLEVAVEAWRQAIPEAVAVVEPTKPVLQTNRLLSQTLVKILAREGLGLVTQSGGLNAADQLAAKDGVPHTTVWRVIDEGREKAPVIERMLGRASFEAAKGDGITVMLSAWPESISGLLTWEPGREKNVMLAPISAMALRAE